MTDKQTLAIWANNLLHDDFFIKVISDLKNRQLDVIVNSEKHENIERECAYDHIKTVDLIVGHLQGLAAETKIQEKRWKIF